MAKVRLKLMAFLAKIQLINTLIHRGRWVGNGCSVNPLNLMITSQGVVLRGNEIYLVLVMVTALILVFRDI